MRFKKGDIVRLSKKSERTRPQNNKIKGMVLTIFPHGIMPILVGWESLDRAVYTEKDLRLVRREDEI